MLDSETFTDLPFNEGFVLLKIPAVDAGDQAAVLVNPHQGGRVFIPTDQDTRLIVDSVVAGGMPTG